MLLLPEVEIKKIIDGILAYIRKDTIDNQNIPDNPLTPDEDESDPPKEWQSLLYRLLEGVEVEKFDFFKEAQKFFLRDQRDSRYLETRLFFDVSRAHLPTIHITLPRDENGDNGLGVDEGYESPEEFDEKSIITYTRAFKCTYKLVITSDNIIEVIMLYHLLRSFLIGFTDVFSHKGIQNISFSGEEIQANTDLLPQGVFMRAINLNFFYEVKSLSVNELNQVTTFVLTPTIINP